MENNFTLRIAAPTGAKHLSNQVTGKTEVREFTHQAIKIGEVYRKSDWDTELDCTPDRVQKWLSNINLMIERGVSIPAISKHGKRNDSKFAMGELKPAKIEDGWLCLTTEIRGEENIRIAEANRISVEIEPAGAIEDGLGNTYGECIAAVAYTPRPVVPGQRFAASLDAYEIKKDGDTMDMKPHFCALEKLAGTAAGTVNENNMTEVVSKHMELCSKGKYMSNEAIEALKNEGKKPDADPKFLSLAARTADSLIANASHINKAVGDKLREKFIGTKTGDKREFSSLMLSLDTDTNLNTLEFVIDMLKTNKGSAAAPEGAKKLSLVGQEVEGEKDGPKGWETLVPGLAKKA